MKDKFMSNVMYHNQKDKHIVTSSMAGEIEGFANQQSFVEAEIVHEKSVSD
jgi:hypothetical protein